MTLTPEQNTLITSHLDLARIEARRQLKYFGSNNLNYNDMCSIGYLTIVEIITKGKYTVTALKPVLTKSIRYAITTAVKRENKYMLMEEDRELEEKVNKTASESLFTDDFDYSKASDDFISLSLKDQELMRLKYKFGLTNQKIGRRLYSSRKVIGKRLSRIKKKLRAGFSEVL